MTASIDAEADAVDVGIRPKTLLYAGYADFHGNRMRVHKVNVSSDDIDGYSSLVAGITELLDGEPHMGDAAMTVHNVVSGQGEMLVRVNVDWDSGLDYRVYFFAARDIYWATK